MKIADYQQAKLERLGNRIGELKQKGICSHGWLKTPPGQSETVCLDCGKVFRSFHDAMQSGKDVIYSEIDQ